MRCFPVALLLVACSDTSPPSWEADAALRAETLEADGISLVWPGARDDTEVTHYEVLRDDAPLSRVSGAERGYEASELADVTEYRFSVVALDAAANRSEPLHLTVMTLDGSAPTWPAGTSVRAEILEEAGEDSPARLRLRWAAAEDNVGVTEYRVQRGETQLAEQAETMLEVEGSPEGLRVVAVDAAGNASAPMPATLGDEAETAEEEAPRPAARPSLSVAATEQLPQMQLPADLAARLRMTPVLSPELQRRLQANLPEQLGGPEAR